MQRSCRSLSRFIGSNRGFCSSTKGADNEKIVASVLFERLPVVIPKIDPIVYAFQEFSIRGTPLLRGNDQGILGDTSTKPSYRNSQRNNPINQDTQRGFRWRQQFRRAYPEEFLKKSDARGKGEYQIDFAPAPRITEADKTNDKRSLQRALDRRLYLLLYGDAYGTPKGQPVWHFPEKVYKSEETLRQCAESALESVIGDLTHTYFVGNAPMGHIATPLPDKNKNIEPFKRFLFKSQVIATNKVNIKCKDFVWVTKDELLEYLPEHREYLTKMIIS